MLFNSLEFILFFPLVYSAYLISNRSWQNRILLIASYFFYASWDWRFLCLLLFSTVLDYVCGLKIHQSDLPRDKKKFLIFSLVGNLAVLAFFKYFNFFSESFYSLMKGLGWTPDPITLNIILPIGISFYTFQTLSYTIDIYKGKLEPTKHFYNFALFVSFFPQLVAGPIERARNLLPQIENKRNITPDHIRDGILLIIWGYFLKVFVADNLLKSAYLSFHAEFPYNGFDIFLANYAYTFVILCDFAGYSNIARGLGKLMGFEISINFHAPYFAPNPIVFWERWHISLTSWIKDYVYAPLRKKYSAAVSILLTFAAIGLWHGGKWNYVIWGVLHGLIILIYRYIVFKKKWRRREDELKPSFSYWMKVCLMYHLWILVGVFFVTDSTTHAFNIFRCLFFNFVPNIISFQYYATNLIFFGLIFVVVEYYAHKKGDLLAVLRANRLTQWIFMFGAFYLILMFGNYDGQEYIYFQF